MRLVRKYIISCAKKPKTKVKTTHFSTDSTVQRLRPRYKAGSHRFDTGQYDRERENKMSCPALRLTLPGSWLLVGLLIAYGSLPGRAQPPEALNYPNVITFGSFSGTICFSNSVLVKTLTPLTSRTFTFTPAVSVYDTNAEAAG